MKDITQLKIGDRVWDTMRGRGQMVTGIVTEITARGGFIYKLDKPYNMGHRIGIEEGGEVYENGILYWEKLDDSFDCEV